MNIEDVMEYFDFGIEADEFDVSGIIEEYIQTFFPSFDSDES